ncbi:hypothetical protein KC238_24500 [Mycobacteroides chelonae]|uniref:hypothetical protein n=1 Tax=Mycobacteroides chelonae TaxID=1774 RepID=UPI001C2BA66D|nr:hypothetical protein [Mycobacteroides chelonae]MBV0920423.1 hypothetical protein [Mycobacteroides chelonae]
MLGLGEPLPDFTRAIFAVLQTHYGSNPQVWEELYATHAAALLTKSIHPLLDSPDLVAALPNKAVVIDSDGAVFQRVCGVWLLAGGHEPCELSDMDLPVQVLYGGNVK